jgi:hypothetical protein
MAKKAQFLTAKEFASKIGISAATVSKMIRDGKISAQKKSGKWMISPDQIEAPAVKILSTPGKQTAGEKEAKPTPQKTAAAKPASAKKKLPAAKKHPPEKTYTIAEFASLTYLTEFGVREWLKLGRLCGRQAPGGEWMIEAANLELPVIKHLVRSP